MKEKWFHLATIALGAGCVVAGVLIPPATAYLVPVGAGLLLKGDMKKVMPSKEK